MIRILTSIALLLLLNSAQAQEITHSQRVMISKKTPAAIWRVIDKDTSYYLVYMNAKYEVLEDQSVTQMTKAQLYELAELLVKMLNDTTEGDAVAHTSANVFVKVERRRGRPWVSFYDMKLRYISMGPNLINILIKDIYSQ